MRLRTILAPVAALALTTSLVASGVGTASATGERAPAATSARAGATYAVLTGGSTSLAVNPTTAALLADNGITITPASEARTTDRGFRFPIQGGLLRTRTLAGTIEHSGGLTLSAGATDLTIRDFTVNTGKRTLSAYVDQTGRRLVVMDLKLAKAKVTIGRKRLTIARVGAVLNAGAAAALNLYYGTDLFQGGLKMGTATVRARSTILRR